VKLEKYWRHKSCYGKQFNVPISISR